MVGFFVGNPMTYIPTWIINVAKVKVPAIFRVLGKILIVQHGKPHLRPPPAKIPSKREIITIESTTPTGQEIIVRIEELEQLKAMREEIRDTLQVLVQTTFAMNKRLQVLVEIKKRENPNAFWKRLPYGLLIGWPLILFILYNFLHFRGGNAYRYVLSRIKLAFSYW